MKKVFVQLVDTRTGGYQFEMIQEPVENGFEVLNALKHFGIDKIDWTISEAKELWETKFGIIKDTSKVVSVIII